MSSVEIARDIAARVGTLPPLPDTVLRMMGVVSDPRSSVDDIVEAIKYDQAVIGEVLRLCNSAYFGLSRKVTSLNDAMLCLGTVKVLQLVMSIHASSMFARRQVGYGLEPNVLWKHSVAVAFASSTLGQRLALPNVSLAFTAGLLHDVGKVVLNAYVAEEFTEIIRWVTEEGLSFSEAEQRVLGCSHEEVGGMIADAWQLPETIVNCIRFHHQPGKLDPPDPTVDTVYLANCICLLLGIGIGEDGLSYRADPAVMERYELHEGDLEAIGAQTMTELQEVEKSLADARTSDADHQPINR